ncbi:MAG: glycosyltransferase family 4 protein [Bacteroidetes bacterium]|nr:glycosyltransferase family 4 protein [Bacteroidota bacterium]
MRIALLTDGLHPYVIGGMQKHSFYLAKYFAKNKVHVDLYHTNQSKYDITKLEFFSDEERKYINSFVIDFPDFGKLPGHYIRESFEYSRRIFELFRSNARVDFVYAKGFAAWKLIGEKKNGFKCSPIGVKFHGMNMYDKAYSFKSRVEQWMLRSPANFNLTHADYIFSYGGKVTDLIVQKAHIPQEKIIEIPTGIEPSWLNEFIHVPSVVRNFIFVGRYDKIKGIEDLTQSIKQLSSDNFKFHFVGPIPDIEKIKLENVIYHGSISDIEKMKSIYRDSDVLVCPSYSEGMPNVILEAMASGLSVIATDVGAVNLMVSKENGWLLSSPGSKEIADAIMKAINISENELISMKKKSVTIVKEKYLWDKIILDTINAIAKRI